MSNILMIEATGVSCSVALSVCGKIVSNEEVLKAEGRHSEILAVMTDCVLKNKGDARIDAVALSSGPGSYTGLRIGSSLAKGLALGWGVPMMAIDTLELMAFMTLDKYSDKIKEGDIIRPMIDARRMEVYTADFDHRGFRLTKDKPLVIDKDNVAKDGGVVTYLVGNGAGKARELVKGKDCIVIDGDILPLARYMHDMANEKYCKKDFVDIAYFEPNYIKEYVAVVGKNKVLGK